MRNAVKNSQIATQCKCNIWRGIHEKRPLRSFESGHPLSDRLNRVVLIRFIWFWAVSEKLFVNATFVSEDCLRLAEYSSKHKAEDCENKTAKPNHDDNPPAKSGMSSALNP